MLDDVDVSVFIKQLWKALWLGPHLSSPSSLLIESSIVGPLLEWQCARVVVQMYLNQLWQLLCASVLPRPGDGTHFWPVEPKWSLTGWEGHWEADFPHMLTRKGLKLWTLYEKLSLLWNLGNVWSRWGSPPPTHTHRLANWEDGVWIIRQNLWTKCGPSTLDFLLIKVNHGTRCPWPNQHLKFFGS